MDQAWVTTALTNNDVEGALTVASSLQRAFPTRKIAVVASPNIDLQLQQALNQSFDFVFYLHENQNPTQLPLPDFAKIYSVLALRAFELCAYIAPTTLALKNCDDIFATRTETFTLPKDAAKNLSAFLFKPSVALYNALLSAVSGMTVNGNSNAIGKFLEKWVKNQQSEVEYLPEKFSFRLTKGKTVLKYEAEVSIVDLSEYPKLNDLKTLESTGVFGKLVAIFKRKLWEQDVSPKLTTGHASPILNSAYLSTQQNSYRKEPIAIVGMSCRYPGSNNIEEFWNSLFSGEDCTGNPPDFRWTREQSSTYTPEAQKTNAGFLKVPVDEFDGKFFGISPKELIFLDPQHRLLHELVWEALEDACVNPYSLRNTSGSVFMGSWLNNFREILMDSGNSEFFRVYMGNSIGAAAARISFLLGITGPSVSTESGCSSATVALHLACKSLQNGETNLALACGVNLLLHPFGGDDLPMFISPDGHSKTFSEDANGFARAEGAGVLVLKRYSDAIKDGDHIWALIRGSATKQEGVSQSLSTPTVECEGLVMEAALEDAGVKPEQISFVEAHGTGTVVGDPLEITAIKNAYSTPNRKEPLVIGAVKTNVGHTESCSGITGIMKVVLSMHNEVIPAHRNFTKLNPACDLEAIPAVLPLERMPWKKDENRKRIAGVSSFGITGSYAHVIVEEPPETTPEKVLAVDQCQMEPPVHLLKISAKTPEAMEILLEKYQNLVENSDLSLADICFSANTGRADFPVRAAVIAKNVGQAGKILAQQKYFREDEAHRDKLGKICFLFTGQGSQYPGMARKLYETSPLFQMHFDYVTGIMKNEYSLNILETLWPEDNQVTPIGRTLYSQTSIFCVEYALLKLWSSWGVTPDFVLGHSLGEFAAAVCAGILTVEEAVKLVVIRSKLIDGLPQGKMLVIKADQKQAESLLVDFSKANPGKSLEFAAINSKEQTVLAGDSEIVLEMAGFLKEKHVKCVVLDATHAFHSRHMDPILEEYRKVAVTVEKNSVDLEGFPRYISGLKGNLFPSSEVNAEYWVQHTRQPVNFLGASKVAVQLGCKAFVEVGPQPVLSAFTMVNNESEADLLCLPSLKKTEVEWDTLLNTLGRLYVKGLTINWHGLDMFRQRSKVRLPHYPFIGKKYWPEMRQTTEKQIHPLLGAPIPNASGTKLFQCGVSLRSHPWIRDHRIGKHAIFPGAAYLEMCLAAGFATVQGLDGNGIGKMALRPMKVENLVIQAPLLIEEEKTTKLQSVVEFACQNTTNEWEGLSVKICERVEAGSETGSASWLPHAQCKFTPLLRDSDKFVEKIGIENLGNTLQTEVQPIDKIYNQLAGVGLNFGANFRSIENLWVVNGENSKVILAKLKCLLKEGTVGHVAHPVILDAMIQAIMMLKISQSSNQKRLHVPVEIGKFVWLTSESLSENAELYVKAFENGGCSGNGEISPENCTALLVNGSGSVVAAMSSVQLVDTTCRAVEALLEQQQSPMPDLWEEQWRQERGTLEHSCDLKLLQDAVKSIDTSGFAKFNENRDVLKVNEQLNKLVYYYVLLGLYDCGWTPKMGEGFELNDLTAGLQILPEFGRQVNFYLEILEHQGILEKAGVLAWNVVKVPPTKVDIETELRNAEYTEHLAKSLPSFEKIQNVGNNLGEILRGKEFQESDGVLQEIAKDLRSLTDSTGFYENSFKEIWSCYRSKAGEEKSVVRILEVRVGQGNVTEMLLDTLDAQGLGYEYTVTDAASSFFSEVEKRLASRRKHLEFKVLSIEKDPVAQGFVPGYYDFIVAADASKANRENWKEILTNLQTLLKPEGILNINLTISGVRILKFVSGLVSKEAECLLSACDWKRMLTETGFQTLGTSALGENWLNVRAVNCNHFQSLEMVSQKLAKIWLIFHEPNHVASGYLAKTIPALAKNRRVLLLEKEGEFMKTGNRILLNPNSEEDFDKLVALLNLEPYKNNVEGIVYCWSLNNNQDLSQEQILQPFFFLTKALHNLKQHRTPGINPIKLSLLTQGAIPVAGNDLPGYGNSTLWGYMRCFVNESPEVKGKCIDLGTLTNFLEIFYELWNPTKDYLVSFNEGHRLFAKFTPVKPSLKALELPLGTDRYQLVLPETKQFADLKFEPLEQFEMKAGQVEIQVKTVALNFRDVFSVLKPTEAFKEINSIGLDWAGVVKRVTSGVGKWKEGDRVFGCNMNKAAFQSHLQVGEEHLLAMPESMTFCEAVTLPAVYATSHYCLFDVAKIKAGDTVLIHTASGGVGLSAIEICQKVGATVIATAGSKRKRNYLRSLGVQHVFNSRVTEYEQEILKLTNGRGVQIVLNSLTSPGYKEATINVCAEGARFVEMSKISVWTPEEVKGLRPDVEYTVVDLPSVDEPTIRKIMTSLEQLVASNEIRTIPYVRFDGVHVREALQFMQKAKHIGKVVCVMSEVRQINGNIRATTPLFHDNATYLITGGLGGIGFQVCRWMLENGAKFILLAGRNLPSAKVEQEISQLNNKFQAKVLAVQLNVSNFDQCRELICQKIPEMGYPDLRGVMHAAGTLSDGVIENQTWDKLSSPFQAKIQGTLNLHNLTKDNPKLEHVVLFSSIAAQFGSPGQSNHAAGNSFEDAVAHYRRSMGLPATSVNWGQWGEVGLAAEIHLLGIKPISTRQGLTALEYTLKSQRTQISVMNVESFLLISKTYPHISTYLDNRVWANSQNSAGGPNSSAGSRRQAFWQKYDQAKDVREKMETVTEASKVILRDILKLEETDIIDNHSNFRDLGVDSLMFVEIKNGLQALFGDRMTINSSLLRNCSNLKLLAETLVNLIEGTASENMDSDAFVAPTKDQVAELLREDSILPENIFAKEGQTKVKIPDVAKILLTGATGTLGPYILRELCKLPQIKEIICIVRPRGRMTEEQRLVDVLEKREILAEVELGKIKCVSGNVAEDKLGIQDENIWQNLCDEIDAVFNCAASVQHVEHYKKGSSSGGDMRSVNIQGFKQVLSFACEGKKLKQVYHASSIFANAAPDAKGGFSESWPQSLEDYVGVTTLAYFNTKFVGDMLMKQAVLERGIPGKMFRFPFIFGDSVSGRFVLDQNHLMLRYMFILSNGMMPTTPFPMTGLPVDVCARTSVALFFNPEVPDDVYNILNGPPEADQAFTEVASRLGYKVELVEISEFTEKVRRSTITDTQFAIFKEFYRNDEDLLAHLESAHALKYWVLGSGSDKEYYVSKKIRRWLPGFYKKVDSPMECIYRDLVFARENGWFEKYGV